jgi:hypothetical protein
VVADEYHWTLYAFLTIEDARRIERYHAEHDALHRASLTAFAYHNPAQLDHERLVLRARHAPVPVIDLEAAAAELLADIHAKHGAEIPDVV